MGCCFSTTEAGAARRHAALLGPPDARGFNTGSGNGGGFDFRGSNADPSALDEDLARLYELKHPLGSGSAGETWLCRCRATGELVAVKLMPRPLPGGMTTSIFREAKIGAQLGRGHLNVVKPRDLVLTRRHLGLVMEYVAGGNMADYILKALLLKHGSFDPLPGEAPRGLVLDEDEARYYFLQVVRAVDFCHRNAVVHRDLKMDNTLLDSSDPPRVKLCDFGFANWWPALGGAASAGGGGGAAPFQSHARPASSQQQQGLPPRVPGQQQQGIDHASSLTRFQGDAAGNTGGGGGNQQREASATASAAAAAALRFPSNVATITGTPDYMSPQILSSKVHGRARGTYDAPKADVWACGVLLCVMLLGRFPFDGANAVDGGGAGGGHGRGGGGAVGGSDSGSGSYFDDGGGGAGGGRYGYPYGGGDQDHYHGAADEAAQRQEQDASMSVYLQQQAVLGQRAVKGSAGEGGGGGLGGSFSRSASGRRRSGSCGGSSGGRAPSLAESVAGSEGRQAADGAAAAASSAGALPSSPGASSPLPRPKRWFDHPALSGSAAFLTEGARDLLARIFEPDEDARISVKGILEHPWSTAPMPEPFCSALEQMRREQERIDGEVAAGRHASRDRDAALKQMVYAASQPFDPNVVSVGAAAVGASVHLGEDKQQDEQEADVGGGVGGAGGADEAGAAAAAGGGGSAAAGGDAVRRVSLSAPPNPAEWAERPRADPAEVARFFAMHSPDGLVSAEPTAHGGGDALGALRGSSVGAPSATAPHG